MRMNARFVVGRTLDQLDQRACASLPIQRHKQAPTVIDDALVRFPPQRRRDCRFGARREHAGSLQHRVHRPGSALVYSDTVGDHLLSFFYTLHNQITLNNGLSPKQIASSIEEDASKQIASSIEEYAPETFTP